MNIIVIVVLFVLVAATNFSLGAYYYRMYIMREIDAVVAESNRMKDFIVWFATELEGLEVDDDFQTRFDNMVATLNPVE